ncbi:uncharacterized protein LOC121922319 isoform X2 [Sceloporus undulatus]|uniref:uncharacterized protein LOC121922319 isoform X2 n=1 Tax=Sceloporus undulatus TaxID=8520 RepID=UPI001C4AB205|nr:uncharacterized protein LOC121922319 isoform X2 [Sceloporus undulatus]
MLCYLALLICSFCSSVWPLLSPDPGLLSQGRTHWQQARELARHPRYGTCWIGALEQLDAGCKELDEEKQSHIALAFAHCHLQRSGRGFPPCKPHSSIRDCTQHMDSVAFGVYTEFFTHAHSICYFLHNEAWQQRAQDTVHRLTSSSESVARQLESTNQLAEEIVRAQDATLRSQEQILQDGELLRQVLHDSSQGIRQAFQALQDSATEQRVAFAEIFNRVAFLQRFVVGESNAIYSLFFNLLSGAASLVLTSCQRTSGARFILLTLVGVNIYLERVIGSFLMDGSEDGYDMTESISFWVGLLRRGFAGLGLAVVAYFIWTYKDPAKQSQQVLQSLQETRTEIQRLLQETERLLPNKPELLLQESVLLSAEDEAFFMDSGFPEQLSSSECRDERQGHKTWTSPMQRGRSPSRLHRSISRQRSLTKTSSPKRRGRSPSRKCRSPSRQRSRTRSIAAQRLEIPVPLEGVLQYKLRSQRSLVGTSSSSINQ